VDDAARGGQSAGSADSRTSEGAQANAASRPELVTAVTAPISAAPSGGLRAEARTWGRDAHRLFDFEMEQLPTQTFRVASCAKFVRTPDEVLMIGPREAAPQETPTEPLLSITKKEDGFWVRPAANANAVSSHRPWLVVPSQPLRGLPLSQGDVLRLGRCKMRVRQLVGRPPCTQGEMDVDSEARERVQPDLRVGESDAVCSICTVADEGDTQEGHHAPVCRICLLEGPGEEGDPLIAPCKCKGSIEHVHLGCLRHWIQGRLNLSGEPGEAFVYRFLNCELCKEAYPTYVSGGPGGMPQEPLAGLPKVKAPFAVLEDVTHARSCLYVLPLGDKALQIGRSSECDVVKEDVTISRFHAAIRYQDDEFLLEDCGSKFGTSLAMREARRVVPGGDPVRVQNGRTVLTLTQEQ
jgi:hypothetical protein